MGRYYSLFPISPLSQMTWTANSATLKLIKEQRLSVAWHVWSPALRILILSNLTRSSELQPFHFSLKPNTHTKLPKFDVMPKNDSTGVTREQIVLAQLCGSTHDLTPEVISPSQVSSD